MDTDAIEKHKNRNVLQEAMDLTSGARQEAYGHPRDNFQIIAKFWNAYLSDITDILEDSDVAMMMILVKIARQKSNHKRDNLVDIAGYARTAEMLDE